MSSNITSLFSKLSYLNTSLFFETKKGTFSLDILPNGEYCSEFNYPIEKRFFSNTEQFIGFINLTTINRVILLNHETDEETILNF